MRMVRIEAKDGTVYVNPRYVTSVFTSQDLPHGMWRVYAVTTCSTWQLYQRYHSESSAEARAQALAAEFEAASRYGEEQEE